VGVDDAGTSAEMADAVATARGVGVVCETAAGSGVATGGVTTVGETLGDVAAWAPSPRPNVSEDAGVATATLPAKGDGGEAWEGEVAEALAASEICEGPGVEALRVGVEVTTTAPDTAAPLDAAKAKVGAEGWEGVAWPGGSWADEAIGKLAAVSGVAAGVGTPWPTVTRGCALGAGGEDASAVDVAVAAVVEGAVGRARASAAPADDAVASAAAPDGGSGPARGGWAFCDVATLAAADWANPGRLRPADAAADAAPTPGTVALCVASGPGLEVAAEIRGAVGAVAAVSCAWMADDNPRSAVLRRGLEAFA
jgi:hypothetical protein